MATMNRDKGSRRETYGKRIKVSERYFNLKTNEDFQFWKASQIDLKLEQMRQAILHIDRTTPTWKDDVTGLIVAYQETEKAFTGCFEQWEKIGADARANLKELEKGVS